jgi:uncharacterized protein (DUF1330 family)
MPAYVLVEISVTDPEGFEPYKAAAPAAVAAHGGRYLARGGETALLEGAGEPERVTLLEFPDLASARAWYDSPEYRAARALRDGSATARFVAVEGLEPGA